jgi:hypothetical protein
VIPVSDNSTYEGAVEGKSGYWRSLVETFVDETLSRAHAVDLYYFFILLDYPGKSTKKVTEISHIVNDHRK